MSKFTFKREFFDLQGKKQTVTLETEQETLPEVLEDIQDFLRGCGFYFDGNLEIISER